MDNKAYMSNYGFDIRKSFNRVGDGATQNTKNNNNVLNLVLPTPLASASLNANQKSKRSIVSSNLKTNKSKIKNVVNDNNIYSAAYNNHVGSKLKMNSPSAIKEPAVPSAVVNVKSNVNAKASAHAATPAVSKSTAMTIRMKNEEAVNDLRKRIPDIEKIFDVHTRIGNGTFSTVLLGTLKKERILPEDARRKFAIKHHIPTSHPERIMRELQCMANIGGVDNVVGINCCMRCHESVAFIMPYMPHDRFHDFFNKMELAEVQFYMKNLLLALRRVHRFNVIHRDVKPSNFLYNRSKRQFLLVDFGLAQQATVPQSQVEAQLRNSSQTIAACAASETNNKRPREQEDNDKNICIKSCMHADPNNGPVVDEGQKGFINGGAAKRLRCSGPQGDQQSPVLPPATENCLTFKMPLKQLNEISTPPSATVVGNGNGGGIGGGSITSQLTNATITIGSGINDSNSKYNTNRNASIMSAAKCFCYGNSQVCNICLIKKEIHASRAGTPGYRPPEVLLKYADQTTAVDIWAAGVIFLSILSSVYPFFKAPNDFIALAEMVTVFGDKSIRSTACLLDRLVTLSQHSRPLDLRKLCVRFRNRSKFSSAEMLKRHQKPDGTCEVCKNCDQYYFNCLCAESNYKTEPLLDCDDAFPASAYDLLYRLLEINPHKRITADQALRHAFFNEPAKKTIILPDVEERISSNASIRRSSPELENEQQQ